MVTQILMQLSKQRFLLKGQFYNCIFAVYAFQFNLSELNTQYIFSISIPLIIHTNLRSIRLFQHIARAGEEKHLST